MGFAVLGLILGGEWDLLEKLYWGRMGRVGISEGFDDI